MLEILIPTYNRPKSAMRAIQSCLAIDDPRIRVRCNSNGYEPSLEKFRDFDKRVIYTSFKKNMGAQANGKFLYKNTNADYCMLLSDEDSLDKLGGKDILDFLDELPSNVKVVSCSIFDEIKRNYYSLTPASKYYDFNLDIYMMLGMPIPSYMSGLIFSTNALHELNLEEILVQSMGNAYSHLDLALRILENGTLRFYNNKFVVKGAEVTFGGDGFSHRLAKSSAATNNLDLNPLVYGPRARARQFYYQDQVITNAINGNKFSRMIAKLYNFISFYKAIKNSGNVTILKEGCDIRQEVFTAKHESVVNNEWSGSIFARAFIPFVRLPWSIGMLSCRIFTFILRVYNKFLWHFLQIKGSSVR
jgi:hypothetical protein